MTHSRPVSGKKKIRNLMLRQIQAVTTLPELPTAGETYSFSKLSRRDVTYGSHGLHKYPAKFIPQFPQWGLDYDRSTPCRTVLDPFCGSGTTLVEAGMRGAHAIGIDVSPLAVLITSAKCVVDIDDWGDDLEHLTELASKRIKKYANVLEQAKGTAVLGMHQTWNNWFDAQQLAAVLALKDQIKLSKFTAQQEVFSLAVLSSIVKSCSYLNEDQIKVRYDHGKTPADPVVAYARAYRAAVEAQKPLANKFKEAGARFSVHKASASRLPLKARSVDRIIASPPYINAVDYTMAHKYNLFALGLLEPEAFKEHCREYIGVTERAVRVRDMDQMPVVTNVRAKAALRKLHMQESAVATNRAYVVAQFFAGMADSFKEAYRVLRPSGLYVFVVGETNRICGQIIPTAAVLQELAEEAGFETELSFFHQLANRSSMRLSRSDSGGTISREQVYVFRK